MPDLTNPLATIATPIIAAAGVLVAAIATAVLTYWTTKKREREAELRKEKLEHYKDFMGTLSGVISGERTAEAQQAFARACNKLNLVAPLSVIRALRAYQEASGEEQDAAASERRAAQMSKLFHAMRDDLKVGQAGDEQGYVFNFWAVNEPTTAPSKRPR